MTSRRRHAKTAEADGPGASSTGPHCRRLLRFVVLVLVMLSTLTANLLADADSAAAHANLLFASPAFDSTVADYPETLTLLFDDRVAVNDAPLQLTGPDGEVALGTARLSREGQYIEVPVVGEGGSGIYTVTWLATAADAEVMGGSYRFAVGATSVALDSQPASTALGSAETAVFRGLMFAALALGFGEHIGRRIARGVRNDAALPRSWLPWAWLTGLLASLGLAVLLLGEGSLLTGLAAPQFTALLTTDPGVLTLIQLVGFAAAALLATRAWRRWSWVPPIAVIIAEALRAHPQVQNQVIGAPLTAIHLTAAALWLGSLVYVLRIGVAWLRSPDSVRQVVRRYSRLGAWLLITVFITGLATGLMLIPFDEVIITDYGRALLFKVGVAVIAAVLAFIARVHLRRGASVDRVRRTALVEAGSLLAVLGLSATLTVLPMPGTADAALDFPPPATGPVAPAAALAGEVGLVARASAGQLVVQLDAPELDDYGPRQEGDFRLSGVLSNEQESNTELAFRRCGTGCFFSAVEWKEGFNQLTLWPEAEDWTSTKASITVEWPVVKADADALLSRAVSATEAAGELTLYEQVTSNTTFKTESPSAFTTTGAEHVGRAPFASGTAPVLARLSDDEEGNRRLILSYPGESVTVELVLAEDDRIIREVLTGPHHAIHRTLVYGD